MSSPALTLLDGVRWHGDPVTGERGHALLAALVLASPRAVGVGDLVDDVWADDEPEHPEKALQVLVSRTRARTAADAVVHTGTGYRIGLREDEVDALCLRRLVVSAREAAAAGDVDVVRLACLEAVAIEVATAAQDGPLGRLVAAALRDGAGSLCESVRLFDLYTGAQVGSGRKSLAFALRFRAPDRTLTEAETGAARDAAVALAVERHGAEPRR